MKTAYTTFIFIFAYLAAMGAVTQKSLPVVKHHQDHNHQFEKAKGEFLIEITSSIDHLASTDEVFELTAHISPLGVANQAEYKWVLPSNLEIVSGATSGVISTSPEEESVVTLSVKQKDNQNAQILFEASTYKDGVKLGAVAQYQSVYQPAINEHLDANKKRVEFLDQQGFSNKVIQ